MTPRQRPTRRQLEVLRAHIAAGSIAAAAHELGISETTARQHLSGLYRQAGCVNAAQAAFLLGTMEGISPGRRAHLPRRGEPWGWTISRDPDRGSCDPSA